MDFKIWMLVMLLAVMCYVKGERCTSCSLLNIHFFMIVLPLLGTRATLENVSDFLHLEICFF